MRASLLLLALAWLPSAARAQCAEGRVSTGEGYCCWPGQSWNDERSRCVGPPRCPPGSVGEGDECVAVDAVPEGADASPSSDEPPAPAADAAAVGVRDGASYEGVFGEDGATVATQAATGDVGEGWPTLTTRIPWGELNPRRTEQANSDWLVPGVSLLLAGYGTSALLGVISMTTFSTVGDCQAVAGGLMLVPVVGGLVGGLVVAACRSGTRGVTNADNWALGALSASVVQIGGAVLFALAFLDPSSVLVFDGETRSLRLGLGPGGLQVSGAF